MYIQSNSLKIYKTKFVRNTGLPHSDGPVMIHLTE